MQASPNPQRSRNDARSVATQERLIASTVAALVELGFAKTTGVEICRRAKLTRGALNHHFPDFVDLLVATLQSLYEQMLASKIDSDGGPLERFTRQAHSRVTQPEFKAVVELWLAAKNDAAMGTRLAQAIEEGSTLFSPEMVLTEHHSTFASASFEATYRTIFEALIGIGLGRAVGNDQPLAHEQAVLELLIQLARQKDQQQDRLQQATQT